MTENDSAGLYRRDRAHVRSRASSSLPRCRPRHHPGVVSGHIDAVTDSEVLQEILYRYFAIGERAAGLAVFDSFAAIMKDRVLPVTEADAILARQFADSFSNLSPRDLIHLAVMKNHGITRIVTADAAFDTVDWVRRSDLQAVAKCGK